MWLGGGRKTSSGRLKVCHFLLKKLCTALFASLATSVLDTQVCLSHMLEYIDVFIAHVHLSNPQDAKILKQPRVYVD